MEDTFIVAVTACPAGMVHTFMAAASLEEAAKSLECRIRVEKQGASGAETPLSAEEIASADLVLIAADRGVDRSRFRGKRIYETDTKAAIIDGINLIRLARKEAKVQTSLSSLAIAAYKHLMNGVSFILPFVIAGGLCSALVNAIGEANGGHVALLLHIVRDSSFALVTPILAAAIAWSIADRQGLAPGMISGMLCNVLNTGLWGGIATGFIAGYSVVLLKWRLIRLPGTFARTIPTVILPFAGTLVTGFVIYFVIGTPLAGFNRFLIEWLNGLQGLGAIPLGIVLGGMMAWDMGGPINKIAYTFAIGMLSSGIAQPMAAVVAAGMTPPLSAALATWFCRSRFSDAERKDGGTAFVLGISFNSEGALPFANRDPQRAIPAFVLGSGLAGALSMFFGIRLMIPHGGLFILPVPGGINDIPLYIAVIASGTLLSALLFCLFKACKDREIRHLGI
jgi:PTS system fructose-specific IIC component